MKDKRHIDKQTKTIISILKLYYKKSGYFFLVIAPTVLLSGIGIGLMISIFYNLDKDTTNLTNTGFAILVSMSAICFSWAKALDSEREREIIVKINYIGERSFQAAIIFIMATGLKYCTMHLSPLFKALGLISLASPAKTILGVIYGILFLWAFQKAIFSVNSLHKLFWKRLKF